MLADPDSQIIRTYGVLNSEATRQQKGMARPGYFALDTKGVLIREKFFEEKYRQRLSGNDVISKLFPELGAEVTDQVEAPHLRVALPTVRSHWWPGELLSLGVEVQLPPGVHVYSPGTKDYKPIQLTLEPSEGLEPSPPVYPRPKTLYLPVIKERVPVFEGTFRIRADLLVSSAATFSGALGADGKTVTISGKLDYQACDSKICYLPESMPVQWQVQVMPLDRQNAPDAIRHK